MNGSGVALTASDCREAGRDSCVAASTTADDEDSGSGTGEIMRDFLMAAPCGEAVWPRA